MKKVLSISLIAITLVLLVVACNPANKAVDGGLALVSFSADYGGTRSLEKVNPTFEKESYYWYYTATKADETGLTTGVKTKKTAVKETQGIGDASVGPFSYGDWIFTLFAYGEKTEGNADDVDKEKLVFKGSSKVTIKENTTTVKVTVSAQMSGEDGYLELPKKGDITITKGSEDNINPEYGELVEEISILSLATENAKAVKYYDQSAAVGGKVSIGTGDSRIFTLTSGSYAVTVSYLEGATLTSGTENAANTCTGGYSVADETIYVTIYDYLTTSIGGSIVEYNGNATFDVVSDGVFSSKKVESLSIENRKNKEKSISVKASPAAKTTSESNTEQETTIVIGAGAISGLESGASAVLSVTAYDQAAAASTIPTFTIENKSSTEATTIGALDIELLVKKNATTTAAAVTKFEEGKTLKISTYISTGLTRDKIHVVYNGEGENGTVTGYDSVTGLLTFTVSHLSQYFVAVEEVAVYVPANGETAIRTYGTFEEAIAAAMDRDTLVLWKDVSVTEPTTIEKNITLDLNKKTLTIKNASPFISVGEQDDEKTEIGNVTIKNGTMKTDRTNLENESGYPIIFGINKHSCVKLDSVVIMDTTKKGNVFSVMDYYSQDISTSTAATKIEINNTSIIASGAEATALFVLNNTAADVEATIENSRIEAAGDSSCAVNTNNYGDGKITIIAKNSEICGKKIGVRVYAGVNVELTNVKLSAGDGVPLYVDGGYVSGTISNDSGIGINDDFCGSLVLTKGGTTYVAGSIKNLPESKNIEVLGKTVIELGKYPDESDTYYKYAGKDMEWRILGLDEGGNVLVISEKVLPLPSEITHSPINTSGSYSWTQSGIKDWLNKTTNGFKALYGLTNIDIKPVELDTEKYADFSEKEKTTNEQIFLLSYSEVALPTQTVHTGSWDNYTEYAVEKSLYFSDTTDQFAYDMEGSLAQWWLRSPCSLNYESYSSGAIDTNKAAEYVQLTTDNNAYTLATFGFVSSNTPGGLVGVRPAFWINRTNN